MRSAIALVALCVGCSGEGDWLPPPPSAQIISEARSLGLSASPVPVTAVAICGASQGQSIYAGFTESEGLVPDAISKGVFIIARRDSGEHDLIFKDASGSYTSALADGGTITTSSQGDLALLVDYRGSGVIEVYRLSRTAKGEPVLLWTTSKGDGAPLTKAAAMVARCVTAF